MSVFNPSQEIIIRPNQSWLHVDWRGIIQYRDLIFLMVRRDFIARYKQTILGPAWFMVNPMAAIVENVRALFFGSPAMPIPYLILSIGISIGVFIFGVLMYQRTARTFIDTV